MSPQLILIFVAMAAIFYLLILRPQKRAKAKAADMRAALEVGVDILTVGGIYGTVTALRDEDFDLEIADGVVMRMDRRAIASVVQDTEDAGDDDEDDDDAPVDEAEHTDADDGTETDGETKAS